MTVTETWEGQNLRSLRTAAKLSQGQLATLSGIDRSALNEIERGRGRRLTRTYAERLAPHLGVQPESLLPPETAEDVPKSPLDRLEELAATLADSMAEQKKMAAQIGRLQARVRTLEAQPSAATAAPKRRKVQPR